jgi:hypothetical protein
LRARRSRDTVSPLSKLDAAPILLYYEATGFIVTGARDRLGRRRRHARNLWHIIGTGEVTQEEVEELLYDHEGEVEVSEESGNPIIFGWTTTGKHIAVIFIFEDDPDLVIVRPKTAYPVPVYGD